MLIWHTLPGCSTWVARYSAWDTVVAIEQLPPQELVSRDSEPLATRQAGVQHRRMGETQEDLQHQAVRQVSGNARHPDILKQQHATIRYAPLGFNKRCCAGYRIEMLH